MIMLASVPKHLATKPMVLSTMLCMLGGRKEGRFCFQFISRKQGDSYEKSDFYFLFIININETAILQGEYN